ncbi:MAG TPA: phage antirepressor protein, partial [Candidatus Moranbacteria bacterium]|nr:phage antirepressor protein [Candidatus Moranbacteria bacterium]
QIATPLLVETAGGKQKMNCANTEGALRLIQSIPSSKAEPFKRWLAKVGYDRIKEIENPELAASRAREIYRSKGYPESWIEKRMRGIEVRESLTNEWKNRGAKEGIEYAILTNEILNGAFEMTAEEYKKFKSLKRENLRDHMDDLELILTMLGEATTTKIHKDRNSKGFPKLQKDAMEGGAVAGSARKDIEKRTGKKISTKKNFLKRIV